MSECKRIINEVKKAVSGKDRCVILTLLAMLAGGNVLIEDIPGVGKTTMALAFSKALGLQYGRVQFTPDTLPSDITGFTVFHKESGRMTFHKGAVFCNLFLADELNRTSSRTQAALLEAMEERQVTVEGRSYPLEQPFSVIATQNPVGASGTQLLPDSQTDRFMIRISMGYPDERAEYEMLMNRVKQNPLETVEQVTDAAQFRAMQQAVNDVYVSRDVAQYIVRLVSATRDNVLIARGASPRATLSLTDMAKAAAYAAGRDYIVPADVGNVFRSTLNHRVILSGEATTRRLSVDKVLDGVLSSVKQPRV